MAAEKDLAEHSGEGSDRGGSVSDNHGPDAAPRPDRQHPPEAGLWTRRNIFVVCILFGINTMNFYDRQVLGAVGDTIKGPLDLTDFRLGILGTAFILLYAVVGVPLGRWADTGRRTTILAAGVWFWSLLTGLSGLAWDFYSMFVFRLGVGVGEASCAPAANSLLGDLFPAQKRARAISIFMVGLPLGLGLSFVVTGYIAEYFGWRATFFMACVPGLLLGLLAWWIPEPVRGAAEAHSVGGTRRQGSPWMAVLKIPTMWWIILSGALHNFNMYALGGFLASYLQRYHKLGQIEKGWIGGLVYGFGGVGILVGGWLCDRLARNRVSARLEVATVALLIATPCLFLALEQPSGSIASYIAWMLPGCTLLYFYYAGVYATVQDIVEPSLRGTAMALYFFAMYLLGAASGPYVMGWLSDRLRHQAAEHDPSLSPAAAAAIGLHDALYLVPALCVPLVLVMFAASRTVRKDHERLQQWIRSQSDESSKN